MASKPLRILIVNPYGIGDVLFSTPLLTALRDKYPDAFIGYMVGSRTSKVLENNPLVNELFVYDKDKIRSLGKWKALRFYLSLVGVLRRKRFDVLIDLSMSSEHSGMARFLLGVKKRIGFDHKGRGRFLNYSIRINGFSGKPAPRIYLELGRFLGIDPDHVDETAGELKFYLSNEALSRAEDKLGELDLAVDEKLVMVVPGGGSSWGQEAAYKQWPAGHFARVADALVKDYGARILITGDERDRPVLKSVAGAMKEKNTLVCGTDLVTFAALMSFCRIVICNDGGPLHIATSQGISTVSFFGPVSEKVYGPYTRDVDHWVFTHAIGCRPCYQNFRFPGCPYDKACLVELGPERVLSEAQPLFKQKLGTD